MPPKKTRTVTTTVEDNQNQNQTLAGYMKNFDPAGFEVYIYRRGRSNLGGNATDVLIAKWNPADVTEEAIGEEFGPGRYLIRPADLDGNWHPSRTVQISDEMCGETWAAANAAGVGGGGDNLQLRMLELQLQMHKDSADRMHGLLTALITKGGGGNLSTKEIIELTRQPSNGGPGEIFGAVRDVLGLARELNPPPAPSSGGADSPWAVLNSILPIVLQKMAGGGPVAPAALPAAATQTATDVKEAAMKERIDFIRKIKISCYHNKPVEFWVNYINSQYEIEEPSSFIVSMVERYDWETVFSGLKDFDAEIGAEPYLSYFKALYDGLKATTPQAEEEPAAAIPAAEPVEANGNGNGGKKKHASAKHRA